MTELNEASNIIYQESGEDANVILGCVIDPKLIDEIKFTVIATGLNNNEQPEFYDNNQEDNIRNKYLMHSTTVEESNENVLDNENTLSNNENNIEKEIHSYTRYSNIAREVENYKPKTSYIKDIKNKIHKIRKQL